ncbi:MAG: hypothetical protein V1696_00495 [Candidatus Jorgensenbacteria bacterium]
MKQLQWWFLFASKLLGIVVAVLLVFAALRAMVRDPDGVACLLLAVAASFFAFCFAKNEVRGVFGFFPMLVVAWMLAAVCSWLGSEVLKIFLGISTFSNFSVCFAALAMCISFDVFRGEPEETQSKGSGWFGSTGIAIGAQIVSGWVAVFWVDGLF